MRSSKSRSRNKSHRNRPSSGNVVNRVFDSSGPEGKVRGTPQQVIDKYNQLARDSQLGSDRVATENFQQHAEHYQRMLNDAQREQDAKREEQERLNRERQADRDRDRRDRVERQEREGNAGETATQSAQQSASQPSNQPDRKQSVPVQSDGGGRDGGPHKHGGRNRGPVDLSEADQPDVMGEVADSGLVETPEAMEQAPVAVPAPEAEPAPKKAPRKRSPRKKAPVAVSEPVSEGSAEAPAVAAVPADESNTVE